MLGFCVSICLHEIREGFSLVHGTVNYTLGMVFKILRSNFCSIIRAKILRLLSNNSVIFQSSSCWCQCNIGVWPAVVWNFWILMDSHVNTTTEQTELVFARVYAKLGLYYIRKVPQNKDNSHNLTQNSGTGHFLAFYHSICCQQCKCPSCG